MHLATRVIQAVITLTSVVILAIPSATGRGTRILPIK